MDRILVPELPLQARVGVTESERAQAQDIVVEIELRLDLAEAGRTDSFERTVDYEQACDIVATTVRRRAYHLIEAIAEACAEGLLAGFPSLTEVRIQVRKPGALAARRVPYAAVEVVRRRG